MFAVESFLFVVDLLIVRFFLALGFFLFMIQFFVFIIRFFIFVVNFFLSNADPVPFECDNARVCQVHHVGSRPRTALTRHRSWKYLCGRELENDEGNDKDEKVMIEDKDEDERSLMREVE